MRHVIALLLVLAATAVAADQVPFVATFTSSVPSGPPPDCKGLMPVTLTGTGTATHMGLFTNTQSHCVNLSTGDFIDGTTILTAANGDTIIGTYSGHLVFSADFKTAAIYGVFKVTGGTGRFAGATGGGLATGTLDLTTGEANDLLLKGTISRPNH
jgi:hypothetical protein